MINISILVWTCEYLHRMCLLPSVSDVLNSCAARSKTAADITRRRNFAKDGTLLDRVGASVGSLNAKVFAHVTYFRSYHTNIAH